jgi:hypothetical protein
MKLKTTLLAAAACTSIAAQAYAGGTPKLDHVFLIMMENHGYQQVLNNPYAPFTQAEATSANLATNYFAVAHPSLTNYLEIVGGSNFNVLSDPSPDWHDGGCQPNIASGVTDNEALGAAVCPIAGTGTDAATPAIDYSNETSGPPGILNIDGVKSYVAAPVTGEMIGDQLVAAGKSWKSYQENLPAGGADGVDTSDGNWSNLSVFDANEQANGENSGAFVALYAVKHDPFAYFASVQSGTVAGNTLANIVPFDGATGLWADLATGKLPSLSFIVPNQCNDQHGRSGYTPFCAYDPNDNGTQTGLNPGGIAIGDQELQKLVTSIKASPAWAKGTNAIVIVWDEDDYSVAPTVNKVALIIDTNKGAHGKTSNTYFTHFSLLKTLEEGFGLPLLNHAADAATASIGGLF